MPLNYASRGPAMPREAAVRALAIWYTRVVMVLPVSNGKTHCQNQLKRDEATELFHGLRTRWVGQAYVWSEAWGVRGHEKVPAGVKVQDMLDDRGSRHP